MFAGNLKFFQDLNVTFNFNAVEDEKFLFDRIRKAF